LIPTADELLNMPNKTKYNRVIAEAIHTKNRLALNENLTGLPKFALLASSNITSADFLYSRLSLGRNRTYGYFAPRVRMYLGLPVSSNKCFLASCNGGEELAQNGSHTYHLQGMVTNRHTEMKIALMGALRSMDSSTDCKFEFDKEVPMDVLGFELRPGAVYVGKGSVPDFFVRNRNDQHIMITDVVISHPDMSVMGDWQNCNAVNRAAKRKQDLYSIWDINAKDVIPLSFDTYGGMSQGTFQFLHDLTLAIANNVVSLATKLMRSLREVIASTLVIMQGRILLELNARNKRAASRWTR